MTTSRRWHEGASYARKTACAAGLALASACAEPTADIVAIWVDGVGDDQGNRQVRIYDAGSRDSMSIRPDIPGTSVDLLQVGIDDRARGVAVSGTDATVWVELGSGRRVTLGADDVTTDAVVAPSFSFTGNGDGLLRRLESDRGTEPPRWLFASLSGPSALRGYTLGPSRRPTERWVLRHATNAPVLVWAEVGGSPSRVSGELQAYAYPSDLGEGPRVDDVRALGRGTMTGRGTAVDTSTRLVGCPDRLCLSPSGREVFAMVPGGGCDLLRWSWVEAESTAAETPPQVVPVTCPGEDDALLTAVLDDDLVVLDDLLRLYLVDLSAGTVAAIPKPSGTLIPALADRGRVLIVSSSQGELVRIDRDGPRMVSGIQSPCVIRDGFVVSPSGQWVVNSCNGQSGGAGIDGQIRRLSVLGAELYTGIPMRPIAVDDDGNALLYSISSDDDDGVPRGLFVLTGDGQLTRVDELEPFPGRVMLPDAGGAATTGRFAAAGPS